MYNYYAERDGVSIYFLQISLGLPEHSLKRDCKTRWGSLYDSITRFLEQEKAVRKILSDDPKSSDLVLNFEELDALQSVATALEPVAPFTDMLSGENFD